MPTAASNSSTARITTDRRAKVIAEVERFYRPQKPDPALTSRKARFDAILALAHDFCAWVVSVPGAQDVRFECLPESPLPDALREVGYAVERDEPPSGERIIPGAIIETAMRGPDGELVPLVEGSSWSIVEIRHSGICKVERWRIVL